MFSSFAFIALVVLATAVLFLLILAGARFYSPSKILCPHCRNKSLECVNWILANPPPNYSFFRCGECRAEYVQVQFEQQMIPRAGSEWEHDRGWDI